MTGQEATAVNQRTTLNRDLARLSQLDTATAAIGRPVGATGIACVFVSLSALAALC